MNKLQKATTILVASCDGNPILTTFVVCLFFCMFSVLGATVEALIFGSRFTHWIDVPFQLITICYSAYAVFYCAIYNSEDDL